MIIVSNTTPIISLTKIGLLSLLEDLFAEIIIPEGVYDELIQNKKFENEAKVIQASKFLKVMHVENEFAVKLLQKQLNLDLGESEAITLADTLQSNLLMIDERKARIIAKNMGLKLTGTLGILVMAKKRNKINVIRPYLDQLIDCGIRIGDSLYHEILISVGEDETI